nr:MAG TPA_asm: Heat shock factor binding protein 1 [Caudoviricetes sp.]
MDVDQAIEFGKMKSRLDSLEQSICDIRSQNVRMEGKLDEVVRTISASAGGKSMLVLLLTLSAAFGGILTKIAEVFVR